MIKKPQYRRPLNIQQLELMQLLVKFRFATIDLIVRTLGNKGRTTVRSRLTILYDQGYINRHYSNQDRIKGKYAVYYISPKGIRALKLKSETREIKRAYGYKTVSASFMNHNLQVLRAQCLFKGKYGEMLKFTPQHELVQYDFFPKPRPDAFLAHRREKDKYFFLEIFETTVPSFILSQRIERFIQYYQDEIWHTTGKPFPAILIICETISLQKRIEKRILNKIYQSYTPDLVFALTSWQTLQTDENKAWTLVDQEEQDLFSTKSPR